MSVRTSAAGSPRTDGHVARVLARAPGRVNLIGDHTDYNEGLALPMAIDLETHVTFTENDSDHVIVMSGGQPTTVELPVHLPFEKRALGDIEPAWGRLAGAVTALCHPPRGGITRVTSTLPMGAGLSSSAAFCVALAMALGVEAEPVPLAQLCQRAEAAVSTDVGLMDPLVSAASTAGDALFIDFASLTYRAIPLPEDVEVVVVHSGETRTLSRTPYASRRAECDAATLELGRPLGQAELADIPGLLDPVFRRRVRHVVTECARVRSFEKALGEDDLVLAGAIMIESHQSLTVDFESSTPAINALVERLGALPGVYGARLTGGGFGGCVVALAEPGAVDLAQFATQAWRVVAPDGASVAVSQVG